MDYSGRSCPSAISQTRVRVMDALGQRDLTRLIELADPEVEWHSFFIELGEGGGYRAMRDRANT